MAYSILVQYLRKEKKNKTIQYITIWNIRENLPSYAHIITSRMIPTFLPSVKSVLLTLQSPTNSEWFKKIMNRCHKDIGNVWIPDCTITV